MSILRSLCSLHGSAVLTARFFFTVWTSDRMDCKKCKYAKFVSSGNTATAFRHYNTFRRAMSNCVLSSFNRPIYTRHCRLLWAAILYHKHEELSVVFQQHLTLRKVHGNRLRVLQTAKTSCRFHRWGSPDVLVDTRHSQQKRQSELCWMPNILYNNKMWYRPY